MGRPSSFSQDIVDEICERLSNGEPLAVICRDAHMPCDDTVRNWMDVREDVSRSIARARERGFDQIAADCLAIADDRSQDVKIVGREGEEYEVANSEFIQRSKVRIETRLKLLAKWDPKRYGDKLDLNHAGSVTYQVVSGVPRADADS